MEINEYHGSYNIGTRTEPVRYIVCHYVGDGDSSPGSALRNCKYFAGGDRGSSAHYFIDDSGIWEYADPDEHYTWHCGDGHGAYGITNRNSIGIEVCIDGDTPYTDTEIGYLAQLVQHLMAKYGIDAEHVVRHYDASRKSCPYFYTPYGSGGDNAWSALRFIITQGGEPQPIIKRKRRKMECLIRPNGENYMVYFDGVHAHPLHHPDEMKAIQMCYRACTGEEIPCFEMGDETSPWATRLFEGAGR